MHQRIHSLCYEGTQPTKLPITKLNETCTNISLALRWAHSKYLYWNTKFLHTIYNIVKI